MKELNCNLWEPLFYYPVFGDKEYPWLAVSGEYNADFTELTIKFRPDGSVEDVSVEGLPDKLVVIQLVGSGKELPVNTADQPTTPLRPQEIILNGSAPKPTATPRTPNR